MVRNGQATVTFDGNTVHMSNEDWIASLDQEQILALNRDIDLQAELGINYDDHPWGEASDRVEWSSHDSSTAAVNYPQGAYYEDIEDLPYTSFARPPSSCSPARTAAPPWWRPSTPWRGTPSATR